MLSKRGLKDTDRFAGPMPETQSPTRLWESDFFNPEKGEEKGGRIFKNPAQITIFSPT
jgi:hypothetical protein